MFTFFAVLSLSAPPSMTYREVKGFVECGIPLVVYAGVPLPSGAPANAVAVDRIPGNPAGVYDCKLGPKRTPQMVMRPVTAKVVPKAAPVATVPGHSHKCDSCGTVWSHADKGLTFDDHYCPKCGRLQRVQHQENLAVPVPVAKPTPKVEFIPLQSYFPSASSCPNGQCPNAAPVTRYRR